MCGLNEDYFLNNPEGNVRVLCVCGEILTDKGWNSYLNFVEIPTEIEVTDSFVDGLLNSIAKDCFPPNGLSFNFGLKNPNDTISGSERVRDLFDKLALKKEHED